MRHKYYVAIECFKRGLYYQGIVHDMSKCYPSEFLRSAKYATGKDSPVGLEKEEKGFSLAWLNHKGRNKHHWQYWVDVVKGEIYVYDMPRRYVIEMYCDFIGAGKIYSAKDWDETEPIKYYENTEKARMIVSDRTRILFENLLYNN